MNTTEVWVISINYDDTFWVEKVVDSIEKVHAEFVKQEAKNIEHYGDTITGTYGKYNDVIAARMFKVE